MWPIIFYDNNMMKRTEPFVVLRDVESKIVLGESAEILKNLKFAKDK